MPFTELDERLSRWLLQARDLLESDDLPLTQEFLARNARGPAQQRDARRKALQEAELITYRRGRIRVLDADALHEIQLRML